MNKFFRDNGQMDSKSVTSTDYRLTIPTTPSQGMKKKPSQRKRAEAERSRTPKKLKLY